MACANRYAQSSFAPAEKQRLRMKSEQASTDNLLANCLPRPVIKGLTTRGAARGGRSFELYREATVIFVDIVGFTRLSSTLKPAEVVLLLHDLVSRVGGLLPLYQKHSRRSVAVRVGRSPCTWSMR